ncbi:MAG: octanoyltransferase [Gammaproteobacteria bacterium RBG_16_51_14]|nr:MAG: octanoyltransferase [Gammaproteobacteria bacterium RBG_16_51_14]
MDLIVRQFGLCDYQTIYDAMRRFSNLRQAGTKDELWCLEHTPVYTLGLGGQLRHVISPGNIPVIKVDRGGQVTYHGPGQLIVYCLLDLHRRSLGTKSYVRLLEQSVIGMLAEQGLEAARKDGAPGVYIDGRKIAALGIRVRRGCSYHGLALNVDVDLSPFHGINPCGYPDLEITRLQDEGLEINVVQASELLLPHLCRHLDITEETLSGGVEKTFMSSGMAA